MGQRESRTELKADIEAVITSYNQGSMILEAVQSVCNQTLLPKGIVKKPWINYRTAPASTNIKSMDKRLELMHNIIEKHKSSYTNNITKVLLDRKLFQIQDYVDGNMK